jgi:hypothetical protein
MTHIGASLPSTRSYVDWPAIFAGAFVAMAISLLASAFGAAIGLSLASPYTGTRPEFFYPALGLWLLWVTVSGFAAGGYVTGRLRYRFDDCAQHEVDVRDGLHGLILWGFAVVVAAALTGSLLATVAKVGAASSVQGAAQAAAESDTDALLRGTGDAAAVANTAAVRPYVLRILAAHPTGSFSQEDRAYLANVLSSSTRLAPETAMRRVDDLSATMKRDADKARKAGIIGAFFTIATLGVGAATAWSATRRGGHDRDNNVDLSHLVRTRRGVPVAPPTYREEEPWRKAS